MIACRRGNVAARSEAASAASSWPSHFPKGVPPSEAVDADGVSFRLVDSVPATPNDFKSQFELFPGRDFGPNLALAHGVSFHRELEDSKRTRDRFKPLREKKIATGALSPPLGRMMSTPSKWAKSHFTVWFQQGATPHASGWQLVP